MSQDRQIQPLQQVVLDTIHQQIGKTNDVQQEAYRRRVAKEQEKLKNEQREIKCNLFSMPTKDKPWLSYAFLDSLFKSMEQENYRSLPAQCSQGIIKGVILNWRSYFASLKEYRRNPSKFTGRPRIPKYIRSSQKEVILTNQECLIKEQKYLKLPLTKYRLNIGKLGCTPSSLKQVRIRPRYGQYVMELVFTCDFSSKEYPKERIMAIDLGIDNLAAIVTNTGMTPALVKGKVVKSINQYYNKQKAHYSSILQTGKTPQKGEATSKRLQRLHRKRFLKIKDFFHKASYYIVQIAVQEQAGVIVIGHNIQWKKETNMGRRNNQSFCHIPHSLLIQMITYKAERAGIQVIVREESYTSKASFLDGDEIPTFGEEEKPMFSGKRISRGLYRSAKGLLINADVNGACNILRKEVPNAFANGIEGLFVSTPLVVRVR